MGSQQIRSGLKRKSDQISLMKALLKHKEDAGKDIKINCKDFTIGRALDSTYKLLDIIISRHHCKFSFDEQTNIWSLTDLSSAGTFVNKVRMEKASSHELKNNDEIELGEGKNFVYTFMYNAEHKRPKLEKKSDELDEIHKNVTLNKSISNGTTGCQEADSIDNNTLKLENEQLNEKLSKETEKNKTFHKFRETVENEMVCAVCNEMFITPITLNCSHTFCNYCITEWKKTKKQCPVCRTAIKLEHRMHVFDNIISSMLETRSAEFKQKYQDLVEERSVQAVLSKPSSSGQTGARGRGGRRGRGTRAVTFSQNNSVIVIDDSFNNRFPVPMPIETIDLSDMSDVSEVSEVSEIPHELEDDLSALDTDFMDDGDEYDLYVHLLNAVSSFS